MHRRLLQLNLAVFALGCSNAGSSSTSGDDAGDEAACLLCSGSDAAPLWTNPAEPPAKRMVSMLGSCTGAEACHGEGAGGMTILPGQELVQIVGVRSTERPELFRVSPGDPAASYLYLKLLADGGIIGPAMPSDGPLDPRRAALAWEWIEAGAPAPSP